MMQPIQARHIILHTRLVSNCACHTVPFILTTVIVSNMIVVDCPFENSLFTARCILHSGYCTTLAKIDFRCRVIQRFSTYTSTMFREKRDSDKGNKNTVTECDYACNNGEWTIHS